MANKKPFEEGEAVSWKYGPGPMMFAAGPAVDGKLVCQWFSDDKHFFSVEFPLSSLDRHDDEGPH